MKNLKHLKMLKHLNTGDSCIGFEHDILITGGIGSCVVVCLWDSIKKIGAMAHMFQVCEELIDSTKVKTYGSSPDTAIPYLLKRMLFLGSKIEDIQVRLVGGGNMFSNVEKGTVMDIGTQILASTMLVLKQVDLSLLSQSVGGRFGREVEFHVDTGLIEISNTNGDTKFL
ncbi:MAG: chemotaxis protein CheD [Oligoflexia bacterium]|nr:chemotaxis protein CheD [Oligoflexia bacterium]